jgi:protein-L-isoaspartate O-methyltransferase
MSLIAGRGRAFGRGLLAAALAAAAAPGAGAAGSCAATSIYKNDDLAVIVAASLLKRPRIERVVTGMDLRPGMKVLDIGSGSGQQSYAIASALKGTGHVEAADIEPALVDYVNAQALKQGLGNLHATCVSADGFDPFYARDRYDRILMWEVYNYLTDRADYYSRLRASLKPGGRVVMVEVEQMSPLSRSFFRQDFKDWSGFLAAIKREPPGTPFGDELRGRLQNTFDLGLDDDDPRLVRTVLFFLNRMLELRTYEHYADGVHLKPGLDFLPEERTQSEWMLHRLSLDLVEKREAGRLELQLFNMMALLNKLIVIQRYRPYLTASDRQPYWSTGPENNWFHKHDTHVRDMEAAGFRLVDEKPFPPFQAVWTFAADEAAPAPSGH